MVSRLGWKHGFNDIVDWFFDLVVFFEQGAPDGEVKWHQGKVLGSLLSWVWWGLVRLGGKSSSRGRTSGIQLFSCPIVGGSFFFQQLEEGFGEIRSFEDEPVESNDHAIKFINLFLWLQWRHVGNNSSFCWVSFYASGGGHLALEFA